MGPLKTRLLSSLLPPLPVVDFCNWAARRRGNTEPDCMSVVKALASLFLEVSFQSCKAAVTAEQRHHSSSLTICFTNRNATVCIVSRCVVALLTHLTNELRSAVAESTTATGSVTGILQRGQLARQRLQPQETLITEERGHVQRLQPRQPLRGRNAVVLDVFARLQGFCRAR